MRCDWCDGEEKMVYTNHFDEDGHLILYCPACFTADNAHIKELRHVMIRMRLSNNTFSNKFKKRVLHQFCLHNNIDDEYERVSLINHIFDETKVCDDSTFLKRTATLLEVEPSTVQNFFYRKFLEREFSIQYSHEKPKE